MTPLVTGAGLAADAGDESEIVKRHVQQLAACLACDICTGLLQDPITAPHCMHCFCRECITAFLVPGEGSSCPVCCSEGVATPFGPLPFRDHLRSDLMLGDLLVKVSPQLEAMNMDADARAEQWHILSAEVAARASCAAEPVARPLRQLPTDGTDCVQVFVSAPEEYELEQPYMRMHESVTIGLLSKLLQERVLTGAQSRHKVELRCRGTQLEPGLTVGEVCNTLWQPHVRNGQLLKLGLTLEPPVAAQPT